MTTYTPEQIAAYQKGYELLERLSGNPESRRLLEASLKVVAPETETEQDVAARLAQPYVEQINKLQETVTSLASSIEAKEAAATEQQAQAETAAAFERLAGMGYTDTGVDAIKKLMVERKIADPEAAAALFDRMNPPAAAEQPGWAPSTWDLGSTAAPDTDVKAMFQDPEKWADGQIGGILAETRQGRG